MFDFKEHSHRRYNPLTGQWILVSPHRSKRPWSGRNESHSSVESPQYEKSCFLCPGNQRVSGEINPNYEGPFVFQNDFSALLPITPDVPTSENESKENALFKTSNARGISKVICFSPRHDLPMPGLSLDQIQQLIHTWQNEIKKLSEKYLWVQVFENKGEIMGCSQPHPHGQIWANDFLPNEIEKENYNLAQYYQLHGSSLLLDYALIESQKKERVISENTHWIVIVPYWASWPFETLLLPKFQAPRMEHLTEDQISDLAKILKDLTIKYDNLFETSFPYSMGWHFAPFFKDNSPIEHWQLHAHFYPPLLRSATVKKFMVGYEMLAEAQRDLTPEQAAQRLRELSSTHYMYS